MARQATQEEQPRTPRRRRRAGVAPEATFQNKLVLAQWAMSFFQGEGMKELRCLNNDALAGNDNENNHTRFFMELQNHELFSPKANLDDFSRYDRNIMRHWEQVTEKASHEAGVTLQLKYFQYLMLLVSELYLDWYFHEDKKRQLLQELNELVKSHNATFPHSGLTEYQEDDLTKVAFWAATGSGKTLVMHVNILQYQEYAQNAKVKLDRIIVLTPNEGLSRQHLEELQKNGFDAELMSDHYLFKSISIIDSGKLISEKTPDKKQGEKSFLAAEFEGNNLILVDEGHHGSSTGTEGAHRVARDQLCRGGFSFEYSATFGQAVGSTNAENNELQNEYAKCILFDYSYRYFYEDGYGKESRILNMPAEPEDLSTFKYMCANLLAYYQQHRLYRDNLSQMQHFGIAQPLCIFVGTYVAGKANSDIQNILRFYADVVFARRLEVEKIFASLLKNEPIIKDKNGNNPMDGMFLPMTGLTSNEVYKDMLRTIFHAEQTAPLHVAYAPSSNEFALSVGESNPFGLVTVGDASKLKELLKGDEPKIMTSTRQISDAIFPHINDEDSEITVLIGAKKFTEGWSSWRVSSMGLMNCGKKEGTQVIQLFGRGVRLKGLNFSLKRSTADERKNCSVGEKLKHLETLQVFGIKADYMNQFKEYLAAAGGEEQEIEEPVVVTVRPHMPARKLLVPQVKDGYRLNQKNGFKSRPCVLFTPHDATKESNQTAWLGNRKVLYSEEVPVQMIETAGAARAAVENRLHPLTINPVPAFDYFDWDGIYRKLIEHKGQMGYWNLSIVKADMMEFVTKHPHDWYQVFAGANDLVFNSFENLNRLEQIYIKLLQIYMERFYKHHQALYESQYREMVELNLLIPNPYEFYFTEAGENLRECLKKLEKSLEDGKASSFSPLDGFDVICFDRHLYFPLIYQDKAYNLPFRYTPLSLGARSEAHFVKELQAFCESKEGQEYLQHTELYLLRNASTKDKGIGFAEGGNFYPDFMMWLFEKESKRQYLTFIDPKGLHNEPINGKKVQFYKNIKEIQKTVNHDAPPDKTVILNSVILSATDRRDLLLQDADFASMNVFFLTDGPSVYLPQLFKAAKQD